MVIKFADLTAGGYGYDANVNGDVVDVTIEGQYQEIQYVLPEAVDLAAYTTLVVDVTSNAQLDIKLVDPNAEVNEYSQKAPFLDGYTEEGTGISSPISFDLAQYADKDLSQINFMAMGNNTTFTLKSITFVAPATEAPAEEPKAEEPVVETPAVEEPVVEEPVVEEPKAEEPVVETPAVEEPKAEEPKAEEPKVEAPKAEAVNGQYVVVAGDYLRKIAKDLLGAESLWTKIYEANKDAIANADVIFVGQKLVIPEK